MITKPRRIQKHFFKHKCWKEGVQLQISSASMSSCSDCPPDEAPLVYKDCVCKHSFSTAGPCAWEFVWLQVVLKAWAWRTSCWHWRLPSPSSPDTSASIRRVCWCLGPLEIQQAVAKLTFVPVHHHPFHQLCPGDCWKMQPVKRTE